MSSGVSRVLLAPEIQLSSAVNTSAMHWRNPNHPKIFVNSWRLKFFVLPLALPQRNLHDPPSHRAPLPLHCCGSLQLSFSFILLFLLLLLIVSVVLLTIANTCEHLLWAATVLSDLHAVPSLNPTTTPPLAGEQSLLRSRAPSWATCLGSLSSYPLYCVCSLWNYFTTVWLFKGRKHI